jgi:hypothetical protein
VFWGAENDLDELPMRRTDNARIIDTESCSFHSAGEWASDRVHLRRTKRKGGDGVGMEVQQRLILGSLPIAYRCAHQGCTFWYFALCCILSPTNGPNKSATVGVISRNVQQSASPAFTGQCRQKHSDPSSAVIRCQAMHTEAHAPERSAHRV